MIYFIAIIVVIVLLIEIRLNAKLINVLSKIEAAYSLKANNACNQCTDQIRDLDDQFAKIMRYNPMTGLKFED